MVHYTSRIHQLDTQGLDFQDQDFDTGKPTAPVNTSLPMKRMIHGC
ncbi:MAG: hypothetical protein ABJA57_05195 [Ginsengibacter sp.]